MGADLALNVAADSAWAQRYAADKGTFDVLLACSGNGRALRDGLDVLHPRGVRVQLGLGGDVSIPQNTVVGKELSICGSFRFHAEFALAVQLINQRRVDLAPVITWDSPGYGEDLQRRAGAFWRDERARSENSQPLRPPSPR